MSRIVYLHGVPKKIVSDKGTQFTSKFGERLHELIDTKLSFSLAYHPQIDTKKLANKSDPLRHVESLCSVVQHKLG
jgi:hypothetical protein